MKRFTFRLQTVLDLRARTEQKAQVALGLAQRAVAEAEERIRRLGEQQAATLRLPPDARFEARIAARTWAEALTQQIAEATHHREALRAEAERRRAELVKAAGERRAVEKLREKALREYQDEMQRQEQNLLDEVGSSRFESARRQEQAG